MAKRRFSVLYQHEGLWLYFPHKKGTYKVVKILESFKCGKVTRDSFGCYDEIAALLVYLKRNDISGLESINELPSTYYHYPVFYKIEKGTTHKVGPVLPNI